MPDPIHRKCSLKSAELKIVINSALIKELNNVAIESVLLHEISHYDDYLSGKYDDDENLPYLTKRTEIKAFCNQVIYLREKGLSNDEITTVLWNAMEKKVDKNNYVKVIISYFIKNCKDIVSSDTKIRLAQIYAMSIIASTQEDGRVTGVLPPFFEEEVPLTEEQKTTKIKQTLKQYMGIKIGSQLTTRYNIDIYRDNKLVSRIHPPSKITILAKEIVGNKVILKLRLDAKPPQESWHTKSLELGNVVIYEEEVEHGDSFVFEDK